MRGPKQPDNYIDREIDCEEAVSDGLVAILDDAEAVGWDRIEAAQAMYNSAAAILAGETGKDPNE